MQGEIRCKTAVEVHGYVEGTIAAAHVLIQAGGRVFGTVKADNADVHGTLQGGATVRQLMNIGSTGSVRGDIKYGRLALAEGGDLSADVRNVPPEVSGDFELAVRRGRTVTITTADLSAFDPDDTAQTLTYIVSQPVNGFVARASAPAAAIDRFTQGELQAGEISFAHDGNAAATASFNVVVVDKAGASSGSARTVRVAVVA